jgi:hypothetical protein
MTHGYAPVRDRIVGAFGPDGAVPIAPDAWEDRILPLVAELEAAGTLPKQTYELDGRRVQLIGGDDRLLRALGARPGGPELAEPALYLYALSGLKDPSVLRRFKEFPDETPQAELEEPWAGECREARVLILLNANPR